MSVDEAVLAFGAFVSCLVASGFLLAFYAPAYREEARKEELRRGRIPADSGGKDDR